MMTLCVEGGMLGESRNGALGLFASFKWKFHQQQKSDGLSVCAAMAANNFKVLGITAKRTNSSNTCGPFTGIQYMCYVNVK